jgi:hypothetical protein
VVLEYFGCLQDLIYKGGFTMIDMRYDGDVPDILIYLFHKIFWPPERGRKGNHKIQKIGISSGKGIPMSRIND